MKNPNKHETFAKIFETGNIHVKPVFEDKSFVLATHGISSQNWNQTVELNMQNRDFSLKETMHIKSFIGPFEKTIRNFGRFGDAVVLKYNTKNTTL